MLVPCHDVLFLQVGHAEHRAVRPHGPDQVEGELGEGPVGDRVAIEEMVSQDGEVIALIDLCVPVILQVTDMAALVLDEQHVGIDGQGLHVRASHEHLRYGREVAWCYGSASLAAGDLPDARSGEGQKVGHRHQMLDGVDLLAGDGGRYGIIGDDRRVDVEIGVVGRAAHPDGLGIGERPGKDTPLLEIGDGNRVVIAIKGVAMGGRSVLGIGSVIHIVKAEGRGVANQPPLSGKAAIDVVIVRSRHGRP